MVQMAMFVVVPPMLVAAGLALADHWMLYLPVVLASFAVMVPPILYADRRNRPKPVLVGSVALLAVVLAGMALAGPGVMAMAAPAVRVLRRFQRARGDPALARFAHRAGARARHGDRGV